MENQQWAVSWPNEGYQVTKFEDADMSRLGEITDTEQEALRIAMGRIDNEIAKMAELKLALETRRDEFQRRIQGGGIYGAGLRGGACG